MVRISFASKTFYLFFVIGGVISYTTSPSTDKDDTYDGKINFYNIFYYL